MSQIDTISQLEQKYFQKEYAHFIDGNWESGDSGELIPVENPTTGNVIAHIQAGNERDIERAVIAAHKAFPAWSQTSPHERQSILNEMARRLKARMNDYAMMETLDNGKTIFESTNFDMPSTAGMLEFYAGTPFQVRGETVDFADAINFTHREPYGVCAAIIPWNIPLFSFALKVAPALATGNTIVLKPAESVCLSVLEFTKEIADLLPPGVLNVVTGYGPAVGEALVGHPLVRKVSFTGSKLTARKIMGYASKNIIPQTMELGGKSANIVCEDADIDAAVEGAVLSTIFNKGEVCIAGTRLFLHENIQDEFLAKFSAVLSQVNQGDPTQMTTQLGPQASRMQYDKICGYLELGLEEGAVHHAGGRAATIPGFENGLFIQPTVFTGVTNHMRIAQEEIFGPVTCAIPWKTEEEVLAMCNDSLYGLGGGLWTRDLARAHRMARSMHTGSIWVNRYYNFVPGMPLGGFKESGFGREGCLETLNQFTHTKSVIVNLAEGPIGAFG